MLRSSAALHPDPWLTLYARLGAHCPYEVAAQLEQFVLPWCYHLGNYREDREKISAFQGMLAVCQANPRAVLGSSFVVQIGHWLSSVVEATLLALQERSRISVPRSRPGGKRRRIWSRCSGVSCTGSKRRWMRPNGERFSSRVNRPFKRPWPPSTHCDRRSFLEHSQSLSIIHPS